jgi:hypothetical protein
MQAEGLADPAEYEFGNSVAERGGRDELEYRRLFQVLEDAAVISIHCQVYA